MGVSTLVNLTGCRGSLTSTGGMGKDEHLSSLSPGRTRYWKIKSHHVQQTHLTATDFCIVSQAHHPEDLGLLHQLHVAEMKTWHQSHLTK